MATVEEHLDAGELGAFVDTQGTTERRKRRKKISEASDEVEPSPYSQEKERDEAEERLEALVFGSQPFLQKSLHDSSSEEVCEC